MVERICSLIKQKGLSVRAVEIALGWGNGSIKRFNTSSPSIDKIFQISEYLNVPIEYILTGEKLESSMSNDEIKLITTYRKLSGTSKTKVVERAETLLDSELASEKYIEIFELPVSAGTGIYLTSEEKNPIKIISNKLSKKASYVLRVSGDSMTPDFKDNDLILVQSTPEINIGDVGVFILNGEGYVKQLGNNELISINKKYKPIKFSDNDDIFFRGKVIGKLDKKDILEQD